MIATNDIDGIAVLGRCDKDLLKFLKKHFQYVVYSGLNNLDAKYDQIICDGAEISHAVVSRLIEQGHNKIAYIGESQNENRYIGYCSALEKAGISIIRNMLRILFNPQKKDITASVLFLPTAVTQPLSSVLMI